MSDSDASEQRRQVHRERRWSSEFSSEGEQTGQCTWTKHVELIPQPTKTKPLGKLSAVELSEVGASYVPAEDLQRGPAVFLTSNASRVAVHLGGKSGAAVGKGAGKGSKKDPSKKGLTATRLPDLLNTTKVTGLGQYAQSRVDLVTRFNSAATGAVAKMLALKDVEPSEVVPISDASICPRVRQALALSSTAKEATDKRASSIQKGVDLGRCVSPKSVTAWSEAGPQARSEKKKMKGAPWLTLGAEAVLELGRKELKPTHFANVAKYWRRTGANLQACTTPTGGPGWGAAPVARRLTLDAEALLELGRKELKPTQFANVAKCCYWRRRNRGKTSGVHYRHGPADGARLLLVSFSPKSCAHKPPRCGLRAAAVDAGGATRSAVLFFAPTPTFARRAVDQPRKGPAQVNKLRSLVGSTPSTLGPALGMREGWAKYIPGAAPPSYSGRGENGAAAAHLGGAHSRGRWVSRGGSSLKLGGSRMHRQTPRRRAGDSQKPDYGPACNRGGQFLLSRGRQQL
eukprot:g1448.t1